ncbi:MAG: PepSY domain-containing protein [Leptolyngbyaceae cyanobacterium SU_3_3]|nr:PepSY domain-containing protein [Leptolyngbyaceae cyanobacterium SU_3_3]
MNAKTIRNTAFHLHRWLGLIGGALLCIAGLTGAVLVFWHEIDQVVVAQQFGQVISVDEPVEIAAIADTVKAAFAAKGLTLSSINPSDHANQPYQVWLHAPADHHWQVFVNQYTGQVMGDRQWETSWVGTLYDLHYKLWAGDAGTLIMGIVALLTLLLSLTGIVLWPGWRKLVAGFKIKWKNAHIKRTNFDIHKVVGIFTAIFLVLIGFTGFAWNVPQANVEAAIYAATLTPKPAEPVSKPIPGQQALAIADLIQRADAVFPQATTTYVSFPEKPEDPFSMGKRQAQETDRWGSTSVYLDQFTGEVVTVEDGLKPTRAAAILNQFGAVHFGTFWGIPSQILYVFVGLAPTVLMGTGVVMWLYRRRVKKGSRPEVKVAVGAKQ